MTEAELLEQMRERLKLAIAAEGPSRDAAHEDLLFSNGDQWPADIAQKRRDQRRPILTVNKTDTMIRQAVNNIRQQRPRIKVHPTGDNANGQTAEVLSDLIRSIEAHSRADVAYDTAADFQVRMGWGYIRVTAKYTAHDSFDQELHIERVANPFSVYFDPMSQMPDGSDAKWFIVSDMIRKEVFERDYGDITSSQVATGVGDDPALWGSKDSVRIVEYWWCDDVSDELIRFADGSIHYRSKLTKMGYDADALNAPGLVVDRRKTHRCQIRWAKCTADRVLSKGEWPGKFLPLVPVYGAEVIIDGVLYRYGMTRNLRDPQRMYNFWRTAEAEMVALAPKAQWIAAAGQLENFEKYWQEANTENYPVLPYNPVSNEGVAVPPPMRQQPSGMPQAQAGAAMAASEDMKAVAGMFDPSLGAEGNETSGVMVEARQKQADNANFHFYDNVCRAIGQVGRILIDLIPHYYDETRVVRTIGEDGKPKNVTLNQPQQQDGVWNVIHDTSVLEYDVIVDTGPGYETKRQDAAESMLTLMKIMPQVGQVAADIIVRNMDFPGHDMVADRLAAINPAASIEDQLPPDVPQSVRSMVAAQAQHIQQLTQKLQQMELDQKYRMSVEQLRQEGETRRTLIQTTTKAHDTETKAQTAEKDRNAEDATWRKDIETKSQTALDVAEIRAGATILGKRMDHAQEHRMAEQLERDEQ